MSQEMKKFGPFDSQKILNYLPHRYPFIFVDRIEEMLVPVNAQGEMEHVGTVITGIKNATINEHYFVGHFPGMPITPGVIQIETIAQVASFAVYPWLKTDNNMKILSGFELRLAGVDSARFRRPVMPGDRLVIKTTVTKKKGPIWAFQCTGSVDGHLAVECDLLASVAIGEEK